VKPADEAPAQPAAANAPTEPEKPATPAPPVMVTVTSYPANAEIYQEGALVGNSPYALSKPANGKDVKLELRLPGYDSKVVTISAATGSSIGVNLAPKADEKPKAEEKPAPHANTASKPKKPKGTEERKPASPGGKGRAQTEVLDPWD
jgi:hypothetical protein